MVAAKRKASPPSTGADGDRRVARRRRAKAAKPARVAALIVASNQARRISATVRGALAIPAVDLVLVIDDGSTDNTQELARAAGAVVVRHSHHRGRAAALETGVSVAGMRDEPGKPERHLLILDGGLGNYSVGAAPLVPALLTFGLNPLGLACGTCTLVPDALFFVSTRTGANGEASHTLALPASPVLPGTKFLTQWIVGTRGPCPTLRPSLSNALEITVQ